MGDCRVPLNKKFFRFSLKAFLIVLTVFCVWFGTVSKEARRQKEAVEWVEKNGGRVGYEWQIRADGSCDYDAVAPWPAFANDYLHSVIYVFAPGLDLTDISQLEKLPNLIDLELADNPISDLRPLASLNRLEKLRLEDAELSDLSPIFQLTNLKDLSLRTSGITDISGIESLSNLVELNLFGNEIVDVSALSKLTALRGLDIGNNKIQDCSPIKKLTTLIYLELRYNPCTEAQINDIKLALPSTEFAKPLN